MPPRIGDLRHRGLIEQQPDPEELSRNGYGEIPAVWQVAAEVWCSREQVGGGEEVDSNQLTEVGDYRIWLRWRPGVDSRMRMQLLGEQLGFRSVVVHGPDVKGHWLEIVARRRA